MLNVLTRTNFRGLRFAIPAVIGGGLVICANDDREALWIDLEVRAKALQLL